MRTYQPDPPGFVRSFDWPASNDPTDGTVGDAVGPAVPGDRSEGGDGPGGDGTARSAGEYAAVLVGEPSDGTADEGIGMTDREGST